MLSSLASNSPQTLNVTFVIVPPIVEDFSTYTSTAHMLSDSRKIYWLQEDDNPHLITLDTTVAYGGSGKSMRCTHAPTGEVISRSLLFPAGKHEDVWVEAAVRFEPTWQIGGAYKLMHILTNISVGRRFGLNMETSSVGASQGGTLERRGWCSGL